MAGRLATMWDPNTVEQPFAAPGAMSAPAQPFLTRNKKLLLFGCGIPIALAGLILAALIIAIIYSAQDPPDISFTIESPNTVVVGEEFTITFVIQNDRASDSFELTTLDLLESYLDKFLILNNRPTPTSSMTIPLFETRSFDYGIEVAAGDELRVMLDLKATEAGMFRGDVTITEGIRSLSSFVQTQVVEP